MSDYEARGYEDSPDLSLTTESNYNSVDDSFDGWALEEAVVTATGRKLSGLHSDIMQQEQDRILSQSQESIRLKNEMSWKVERQTTWDLDALKGEVTGNTDATKKRSVVDTRKPVDSSTVSKEKVEVSTESEALANALQNLAKNKNINYPWTNDSWKCSSRETSLALWSVKVFQELLNAKSLRKMIDTCSNHKWALSRQEAEQLKTELGINSKAKDIQSFYQSYLEYKNPNSEYEHLKGLMNFLLENGIDSADKLAESLSNRSRGITSAEISNMWRRLFREIKGRRTYYDAYQWKEVDHKPSDWRQKASFEIIKSRLQEDSNKDMLQSEKMLALLWDFNFDWEINRWDTGYKTWSQFADVFRMVVATAPMEQEWFNSDTAVKHLVEYAKKCWVDLPNNISSVKALYQWMTKFPEGYANTTKLQNFIKNLPIDLWDVLKNGTNAWAESLESIVMAAWIEQWNEKLVSEAAIQKVKEIIEENKQALQEAFPNESDRRNVTQQMMSQLPWMLIEQALNQQSSLALGTEIPLDQLIKWASTWLGFWIDKDWKPSFGRWAWWSYTKKEWRVDSSIAITSWLNAKIENISDLKWLYYVNLANVSIENWFDLNEWKRNETLDATGLKRFSIWENVGIWLLAWIPQLTWWVNAWFENNKLAGIESQAENIKNVVTRQAEQWISLLSLESWDKKTYFKSLLKQSFKGASEASINTAADNIYSVIDHFVDQLNEKTPEYTLKTYAKVIGDVFTEQWRNAAIQWIANNKRIIEKWQVWAQFFNLKPSFTLIAQITRYYNVRTVESENSKMRRMDAAVNGTWNRPLELWESKELWADNISQINKILERYWAPKDALTYIKWDSRKPGRIQVPASLPRAWININVSQSLKWYVQKMMEKRLDGETYYLFPANTVYRLFQETGWNEKSMTLNIGSEITNIESDVSVSNQQWMEALLWIEELMWEKRREFTENSKYENLGPVDYKINLFDELFTSDVVEWLKNIDSKNRRKFSQFMKNKRDAGENFQKTVDSLVACLNDKKFSAIKEKLQSSDVHDIDKQIIMDRIMAISSEANVHTKYWLEATVNGNSEVTWRWEYYKKESMKWPNWQSIFDKIPFNRDDLIKKIEEWNNYEAVSQPNLLWATAFYNKNNTAKGLAITWLWATKVLWWQTTEISWEDRTKVENWFLWEGEWDSRIPWALEKSKSPVEWENLNDAVCGNIRDKVWEFKTDAWVSTLTEAQLKKLLKWEEVELNLDNSEEIVKVKQDVMYVKYLMWECGNESIGMQLGDLHVMRQEEVQDYKGGELWLNDQDWSSRVAVSRKDTNIGISFTVGKKEEKKDELADTTPKTVEVPNSTPEADSDNKKPEGENPPKTADPNKDTNTTGWWGR